MNTSDVLLIAQQKLEVPGVWVRRYYALDAENHLIAADSPQACKFCAMGAILNTTVGWQESTEDALNVLVQVLPTGVERIPVYNDSIAKSKHDIIDKFSRAHRAALDHESNQLCPEL